MIYLRLIISSVSVISSEAPVRTRERTQKTYELRYSRFSHTEKTIIYISTFYVHW